MAHILYPVEGMYRLYQSKVNSSKNDSKLKRMWYLVHYLCLFDKPTSCLPPIEKSWCVTINNDSVATSINHAKMQLCQANENKNSFEINLEYNTILRGHDECV